MDWVTPLLAVIAALFGGGGVAALLRARGQNRADVYSATNVREQQLAKEQADFRASILQELAAIRAREEASDRRNTELTQALAERTREIGGLQQQNVILTDRLKEIEGLYRQAIENTAQLKARIEQTEAERAEAVQRLQSLMSIKEFLERENNELRAENRRLREKLPARVERPVLHPAGSTETTGDTTTHE